MTDGTNGSGNGKSRHRGSFGSNAYASTFSPGSNAVDDAHLMRRPLHPYATPPITPPREIERVPVWAWLVMLTLSFWLCYERRRTAALTSELKTEQAINWVNETNIRDLILARDVRTTSP